MMKLEFDKAKIQVAINKAIKQSADNMISEMQSRLAYSSAVYHSTESLNLQWPIVPPEFGCKLVASKPVISAKSTSICASISW